MIITKEISLIDFDAWCGAIDTQNIIFEFKKEKEFENLINELYPQGIDETQLNDLLRFEADWIFEMLGIELGIEEEE